VGYSSDVTTNIRGDFGVASMFDFWWCSELSSSERAE
jgi:hypothetical protein